MRKAYKEIPVGTRFHKITVGEFCGFDYRHHAMFECKCDCGTTKQISGSDLRYGAVKSCGCLPRERMSKLSSQLSPDETGKRFGKLVATKRLDPFDGLISYECLCDCGNTAVITGSHLRDGSRENCGAWACQEDMAAAFEQSRQPQDLARDAYFAGHFDGEGCVMFGAAVRGEVTGVSIRVSGVFKPTVLEYKSCFGGTVSKKEPNLLRNPSARIQWGWVLMSQAHVFRFLNCVLPYAREKKAQLQLAHDYLMERVRSNKYQSSDKLRAMLPGLEDRMAKLKQYEFAN